MSDNSALDPQLEAEGTRLLLRDGDVEGGLVLLARAARAGSASALATHSWWCLQHGYESVALELSVEALPACETRTADPNSGYPRRHVVNAASNIALCQLALGGDYEPALAVWRDGAPERHAESWFYPGIVALRQGREDEARRIIERLPAPTWTRLRREMVSEAASPSAWFGTWCADGVTLLDMYPSVSIDLDDIDFEGLLIESLYADDWTVARERADQAASESLEALRALTREEGEVAHLANLRLGAELLAESDPGTREYREGWALLRDAMRSADVRTVQDAVWECVVQLNGLECDQESQSRLCYAALALGGWRAVSAVVSVLVESDDPSPIDSLLAAANRVLPEDPRIRKASHRLVKLSAAYLGDPPASVSATLAQDESAEIRRWVLSNPLTDESVRRSLLDTCVADREFLYELLSSWRTPDVVLADLAPMLMPWEPGEPSSTGGQGLFVPAENLGPALVALAQHENTPEPLLWRLSSPECHEFIRGMSLPAHPSVTGGDDPLACLCPLISSNPNAHQRLREAMAILHEMGATDFGELGAGIPRPRPGSYAETWQEGAFRTLRDTLERVESMPIRDQVEAISTVLCDEFGDMEGLSDSTFLRHHISSSASAMTPAQWRDLSQGQASPTPNAFHGAYEPYEQDLETARMSLSFPGAKQRIAFMLAMVDSRGWLPEPTGSFLSHEAENCAAALLAWTGLVVDDPTTIDDLLDIVADTELLGSTYLAWGLAGNSRLEKDTVLRVAPFGGAFAATHPQLSREEAVRLWGEVDLRSADGMALLGPPLSGPHEALDVAAALVSDLTTDTHALRAWSLVLEGAALARGCGPSASEQESATLIDIAQSACAPSDEVNEILIYLLERHDSLAAQARLLTQELSDGEGDGDVPWYLSDFHISWFLSDQTLIRSKLATEKDFMRIAREGDEKSRVLVAASSQVPHELLSSLALDESPRVRTAVYCNPCATEADRAAAALLGVSGDPG